MEGRQISLWDYVIKELRKWKLILLVAVIGGIAMGAAGYLQSVNSYNSSLEAIEAAYTDTDEQIKNIESSMTDESISNSVKYCAKVRNLRSQEEYMEKSILMNLDGNRLHEINYVIAVEYQGSDSSSDRVADLSGNIASIFQGEDFLKAIGDEFYPEYNAEYVLELIEVEKTSNPQNLGDAASTINLTIIIPDNRDSEECDKLVEDFVREESNAISNYKIQVINSNGAYVSDVLIINKQRDTYNYIDAYRTKLETDKGNLTTDEQKLADLLIAKELQENGIENKITKQEAIDELSKPGISKKYIVVGILFGIIVIMGWDFVMLVITPKINTMEELCSYFDIKPLMVLYDKADKGFLTNSKLIYNWQHRKYSDVEKQTNNYIRQMEALKNDDSITEIELLTCHELDDDDMEYIGKLREATGKAGIKLIESEVEFIGEIDTSSQLRGDTPVMFYIRQNETILTRLADVKMMADKNERKIVGFVYIDC